MCSIKPSFCCHISLLCLTKESKPRAHTSRCHHCQYFKVGFVLLYNVTCHHRQVSFVLFYSVTCSTDSLVACTMFLTLHTSLNITCTLLATCVELKRLECSRVIWDELATNKQTHKLATLGSGSAHISPSFVVIIPSQVSWFQNFTSPPKNSNHTLTHITLSSLSLLQGGFCVTLQCHMSLLEGWFCVIL